MSNKICLPNIISMVTTNKNELWKTVRWTSFQKPQLQSVAFFFKFFHPCFLQYLRCHLHLLQTFRAVMHQSIPAPPTYPTATAGHLPTFSVPGVGHLQFLLCSGTVHLPTPRAIPELLTRTRYAFALFFRPHPGWFDNWRVPTPRNLVPSQKKIANARESAGDGGGGGGGVGLEGSWAQLELTDAIFWWFTQFQWLQFAPSEFWYWISWHISFNSSSCR